MKRSAEEPENEENAFQNAFKQKLESYRAPINAGEWNRLEETLNAEKSNKRRNLVIWLAAACITLLLLTTSVFTYLKLTGNQSELTLKTVAKSDKKPAATTSSETIFEVAINPGQNKGTDIKQLASNKGQEQIQSTPETSERSEKITEPGFMNKPENAIALNQESRSSASQNIAKPSGNNSETKQKSENASGAAVARQARTTGTLAFNSAAITRNPIPAASSASDFESGKIKQKPAKPATGENAAVASGKTTARNSHENGSVLTEKSSQPEITLAKVPEFKNEAAVSEISLAAKFRKNESEITESSQKEPESEPVNGTGEITSVEPILAKNTGSENASKIQAGSEKTASAITPALTADSALKPQQEKVAELAKNKAATEVNTNVPQKLTSGKWQLALTYSVLKFDQNIKVNGYGNSDKYADLASINSSANYRFQAEREFNENTKSAYSWQAALKVGYQVQSHLILQTGLNYAAYQAQTSTTYFLQKQPDNSYLNPAALSSSEAMPVLNAVIQSPDFPDQVEDVQRDLVVVKYGYHFVSLPLQLQYHTNFKSNWNIFAGAGGAINYLVKNSFEENSIQKQKQKSSLQSSSAKPANVFRAFQTSINSTAGVTYKLNEKLSVMAGAEGNYYLKPLTLENQYLNAGNFSSFGLTTGLTYQF